MKYSSRTAPLTDSLIERFYANTEFTVDGCWTWTGTIGSTGYGQLKSNYVTIKAHHLSLKIFGIDIPTDLTVDHLCRNKACVRPTHLELVTTQENTRRSLNPTALNSQKTTCPKGHPYSGRKGNQRICRICINENARRRRAERKASS